MRRPELLRDPLAGWKNERDGPSERREAGVIGALSENDNDTPHVMLDDRCPARDSLGAVHLSFARDDKASDVSWVL